MAHNYLTRRLIFQGDQGEENGGIEIAFEGQCMISIQYGSEGGGGGQGERREMNK
jgi:hypothetical protein